MSKIETKTNLRSVLDIPNAAYDKHKKRIKKIDKDCAGDKDKEKKRAKTMANRIITIDKAYGRYLVCEEFNKPHMSAIFLDRFKALAYTVHDWRKDKIQSFLDSLEDEEEND